MTTLDGVMQAPGGQEEDTEGGFKYGGWTNPYGDEIYEKAIQDKLKPAEYLLGRKTFEIWEQYWPHHNDFWPSINANNKYVYSNSRKTSDWAHTSFISNVSDIKKLKDTEGHYLHVWGSSQLIPLLLNNDLVDELHIIMHPLILGYGKNLFDKNMSPAYFTLMQQTVSSSGVIIAYYKRVEK